MDEHKHSINIVVDHPVFCLFAFAIGASAIVQIFDIIMEPIVLTVDRKTKRKYLMRDKGR